MRFTDWISAKETSSGTCDQQQADQTAINDERPRREVLQDAQQSPDRKKGRHRSRDDANREHRPGMGIKVDLVELPEFLAPGERNRRQAKQEGETRGLHALEAQEECGGERGAGAGHARD